MAHREHHPGNDPHSTGMARFIRRYSDEQLDAFLHAICIDGITVAEAVRRAEQGRLGVASFALNLGYAYDLAKKRREDFEERNPEALELATQNELRRLHRLNLKRSRGLTEASDPDEIKRAAQALSATRSAMRGPGGSKPKVHEPAPAPEVPAPRGDDVLTRLLGNEKSPAGAGL